MALANKILTAAASRFSLNKVKGENVVYGVYHNYNIIIQSGNTTNTKLPISISFFIKGEHPNNYISGLLNIPVEYAFSTGEYLCRFNISSKGNVDNCIERIKTLLNTATMVFMQSGYVPCDSSGNEGDPVFCRLKGSHVVLTEENYQKIALQLSSDKSADAEKKENVPMGILGALLGSLAASLLVFMCLRIGVISSGACLLLGAGIVGGYKYKGYKLSPLSALFCLIFSSGLSYLLVRIDTALEITSVTELDFATSFKYLNEILKIADATRDFYQDLTLSMILCILGSVITIAGVFGLQKQKFEIIRYDH